MHSQRERRTTVRRRGGDGRRGPPRARRAPARLFFRRVAQPISVHAGRRPGGGRAGWAPDFGPSTPHPSAGASVVGARMPLIAYNINLATDRIDVAKKIAAAIRQSSGGFRFVKAAGFTLADRGIAQVSMNLTNYEKTPIFRVFETVKREAARYGVSILESEIVGLIPSGALAAAAEFYLQIEGFKPEQVLENKLRTE